MRRQIELSNDAAVALAGSEDAVLREIDNHVDCDVFLRGNVVTLDGSDTAVAAAEEVVREVADLIAAAVAEVDTELTRLYGLGPIGAAAILGEVADIRRYRSRHAFAAANGTAPIPASSGRTTRHRLNRSGNRQLNRVLYTMAITQIRADTEGRAYYLRKRAEGKTSREALRCLKRRLSDVVYKTLHDDLAAGRAPAPALARR